MLAITPIHHILSITDLNNPTEAISAYFLKFFNKDVQRRLGVLAPSIFPFIIRALARTSDFRLCGQSSLGSSSQPYSRSLYLLSSSL